MSIKEVASIWVCQDCALHHANGECGGCHSDHGHDREPLGLIEDFFPALDDGYDTYSTSSCEGCGSHLHGERHKMSLFSE